MRIITGIARGTKLKTLEGKDTRPTTEMCKEGVFSAIQFQVQDRKVLDLFGGCGQMALEALSRGAERAVIIDNSRAATEIIKETPKKQNL
jgi:16S rRNA (guanine(966)-N(2))-methyltransferase RsmD